MSNPPPPEGIIVGHGLAEETALDPACIIRLMRELLPEKAGDETARASSLGSSPRRPQAQEPQDLQGPEAAKAQSNEVVAALGTSEKQVHYNAKLLLRNMALSWLPR